MAGSGRLMFRKIPKASPNYADFKSAITSIRKKPASSMWSVGLRKGASPPRPQFKLRSGGDTKARDRAIQTLMWGAQKPKPPAGQAYRSSAGVNTLRGESSYGF